MANESRPESRVAALGLTDALEDREPDEVIRWALGAFARPRVPICTSFQVDGMAILDMAWRIDPEVRVFTIDTGRLPPETYAFVDRVQARYGIRVEVYCPQAHEVEAIVQAHGVNLFCSTVPLRLLCCEVRKVNPLTRALRDVDAWITGLRRDQGATRGAVRQVERDARHGGILKVNPLAPWTEAEVWAYTRAHDVPVHPLYARGYGSIGCAPCTRALAAGEDARAGRWWWETDTPKECGLHWTFAQNGTGDGASRSGPGGAAAARQP